MKEHAKDEHATEWMQHWEQGTVGVILKEKLWKLLSIMSYMWANGAVLLWSACPGE